MRDRITDFFALVLIPPAFNRNGDELGRTLAVAHDGLRKIDRNFSDGVQKTMVRFASRISHFEQRRFAARNQHQRVIGRSVAIHRDAVE